MMVISSSQNYEIISQSQVCLDEMKAWQDVGRRNQLSPGDLTRRCPVCNDGPSPVIASYPVCTVQLQMELYQRNLGEVRLSEAGDLADGHHIQGAKDGDRYRGARF